MALQQPLLDQQYNPTELLRSYSDAVFRYLDTHYEPKGTRLLEPEKMKALLCLLSPTANIPAVRQISFMVFNIVFLAFRIETVFTAHGPSVTSAGLVAYLRSEIMSDPSAACVNFKKATQEMQIGPSFDRWQFPQVAEPRAKELTSYVSATVAKTTKDMNWSSAAVQEQEINAMKVQMALAQKGRQAALDLISPRVCYSCHRYPCSCF